MYLRTMCYVITDELKFTTKYPCKYHKKNLKRHTTLLIHDIQFYLVFSTSTIFIVSTYFIVSNSLKENKKKN